MIYGQLEKWHNGAAKVLVVILHHLGGSGSRLGDLVKTTHDAFAKDGVDLYRPALPYAQWLKAVRLNDIAD
jgi:hypothetical protein